MNIYSSLKESLCRMVQEEGLEAENIIITARGLSPVEAIGITQRQDYPILNGKEIMMEAEFKGAKGQAFTSAAGAFSGSLKDILNLDIEKNGHDRSLFIAALNAVMRYLGRADSSVHCKNQEPEECAAEMLAYLQANYNPKTKITQIGFQPAFVAHLSGKFPLRVLDLDENTVGTNRYGVEIEHGITAYDDAALNWADLVLCTGSTICNGSIVNFLDIGKPVFFYGTTLSGAAPLLGLKRLCFHGA